MTPDQFQTVALGWLSAVSAVGIAASVIIAKNWTTISNAIVAVAKLKARIDAHDDLAGRDTSNLVPSQASVDAVAKSHATSEGSYIPPGPVRPPPKP